MSSKSMKKSFATLLVSLCFISLLPGRAFAWGPNGHRIVAQIAQNHLTPRARRNISRVIGNATLASVANFADTVVHTTRPETRKWHFVDIPVTTPDSTYDPSRDCKPSKQGDCAIAEIDRLIQTLSDPRASKAKRAEAIKFLVHFVGDLHQPLHSAERNNDRGGNDVIVTFFGSPSQLHKVWDSGILVRAMRLRDKNSEANYIRRLERGISSGAISASDAGTDVDWANEAHKLATDNTYGKLTGIRRNGSFTLEQPYYDANLGVVDQQLARAGLRLAKVLNDLFDK